MRAAYRVHVESEEEDFLDTWHRDFDNAHDALVFYRRCGNVQETIHAHCKVLAQRWRDGEWETVFRRVADGVWR